MKLLTFTIPCYNSQDYMRHCIESILPGGEDVESGIAFETPMENAVWLALKSLEEKYRLLLYLYYYEGYSVRELTKILRRKESTLQTQLAAGRRKLKEILQSQSEKEGGAK